MFTWPPWSPQAICKDVPGMAKTQGSWAVGTSWHNGVYAPLSCSQACNYYSPYPNGCAVMSETWNNALIKKIFHQDANDTQYTAEV